MVPLFLGLMAQSCWFWVLGMVASWLCVGGGNMGDSKQEWRQKLAVDTLGRPSLNALLAGRECAGPVAGSSAWLQALPANS